MVSVLLFECRLSLIQVLFCISRLSSIVLGSRRLGLLAWFLQKQTFDVLSTGFRNCRRAPELGGALDVCQLSPVPGVSFPGQHDLCLSHNY